MYFRSLFAIFISALDGIYPVFVPPAVIAVGGDEPVVVLKPPVGKARGAGAGAGSPDKSTGDIAPHCKQPIVSDRFCSDDKT